MTRRDWLTMGGLCVLAATVQGLAMAGVAHVRGSATAYAYTSPDADEYVAYARGIAWQGRFARIDHDGRQLAPWPDTWRTPGYPAVLAVVVRIFGDSTVVLLGFHQLLTLLTVPLLWLILRRFCSPRWALVGALGWCLDPFRVYYSLWLLAETLFTLVLLVWVWVWARWRDTGWTIRGAFVFGGVTGALVLIRPIALPFLVLAPVVVDFAASLRRCREKPRRLHDRLRPVLLAAACGLTGLFMTLSWNARNAAVARRDALTSQTGASFAYHKAVDVVLWREGRSRRRFDSATLTEVRDRFDAELREQWARRFGPPTPEQASQLTWRKLNYGQERGIDAIEASSILKSIALRTFLEDKLATAECFAGQGLSMLVFPLGLVLFPPVGAAPFSMLGGGSMLSRVAAGGIGLGYAILVAAVTWRLLRSHFCRGWFSSAYFLFFPAAALFLLSLPSEDPRFRLPIIPLFWAIALARGSSVTTAAGGDEQPNT
jgi:hypothetical protein